MLKAMSSTIMQIPQVVSEVKNCGKLVWGCGVPVESRPEESQRRRDLLGVFMEGLVELSPIVQSDEFCQALRDNGLEHKLDSLQRQDKRASVYHSELSAKYPSAFSTPLRDHMDFFDLALQAFHALPREVIRDLAGSDFDMATLLPATQKSAEPNSKEITLPGSPKFLAQQWENQDGSPGGWVHTQAVRNIEKSVIISGDSIVGNCTEICRGSEISEAVIGPGVKIGHSVIIKKARIGSNSSIGSGTQVYANLGPNVKIDSNTPPFIIRQEVPEGVQVSKGNAARFA